LWPFRVVGVVDVVPIPLAAVPPEVDCELELPAEPVEVPADPPLGGLMRLAP
jgi:hypothetical protein